MISDPDLALWLAVWFCVTGLIVYLRWKRYTHGVGLIICYLASLWTLHAFPASLHMIPWHPVGENTYLVKEGFRLATWGVCAIALGTLVIAPFLVRTFSPYKEFPQPLKPDPILFRLYVGVGLFAFFILSPLAKFVPTATSVVSGVWKLTVVGASLALWHSWQNKRMRNFGFWLLATTIGLPVISITHLAHLSYGAVSVLAVLAFILCFFRPRWLLIVLAVLVLYAGISFYITYMRDRPEIRDLVWGGYGYAERFGQLFTTTSGFEWFNPKKELHLFLIDGRLNQNFLVGAAWDYIGSGFENFAHGETLWQAVLALVPRFLWPGKTVVAGSMGLVTTYTGIEFAEGTSVGLGQVMEFYVNFGVAGIFLGMLIISTIISVLDDVAGRHLANGDWQGFSYWYLPALSLIDVGGSLVEMTAGAAAAVVAAYLCNRFLLHRFRGRKTPATLPSTPS